MKADRRQMRSVGLGVAAATAMLIGGAQAAAAGSGGAVVTQASGPTWVYPQPGGNPLAGVSLRIHGVQTPSGKTIVSLHAAGFDPALAGQTFGAHVHINACGPAGAAAGPHYKNVNLPATPAEAREIWLDLTVNPDGTADARAKRDWVFTTSAQSVVVHAQPTDPLGVAGTRLACTNAPFHP